ncbi:MAG: putative sulfate/molybdate transporter [Gemmatimonadaceae bacterium]|nr:putative sulfate/molybdate transporter [Gemmatimonadaceae bacterium]
MSLPEDSPRALRFDRREWGGAIGDLGTDLPLLFVLITALDLNGRNVLWTFGAMQIASGLFYRMPMPVQPLKAMATIAAAGGITAATFAAGGLVIGGLMLALVLTGTLERLAKWVPLVAVRGLQLGLAIQLFRISPTLLNGGSYYFIPEWSSPVVGALVAVIALAMRGNTKVPAAVVIIPIALVMFVLEGPPKDPLRLTPVEAFPDEFLTLSALKDGLLLLALPQIGLSLGNAVIATRQVARDLFPDRAPSATTLGGTYAAMNLVAPFLGGIPTCHGSGGIAGHYAFGGRTGGSVIIYGAGYLLLGALFAVDAEFALALLTPPVLGGLLVVEALAMTQLAFRVERTPLQIGIVLVLGAIAAFSSMGYLIALALGIIVVPRLVAPPVASVTT